MSILWIKGLYQCIINRIDLEKGCPHIRNAMKRSCETDNARRRLEMYVNCQYEGGGGERQVSSTSQGQD